MKFYTSTQAAAKLGMSVGGILDAIRSGQLEAIAVPCKACKAGSKRQVRYRIEAGELDAWNVTRLHGPGQRIHTETANRYNAGESIEALANDYGVKRSSILKRLQRAGVKQRPDLAPQRKWTMQEENSIVMMLKAGAVTRTIAAWFGVTPAIARYKIAHMRKSGKWPGLEINPDKAGWKWRKAQLVSA